MTATPGMALAEPDAITSDDINLLCDLMDFDGRIRAAMLGGYRGEKVEAKLRRIAAFRVAAAEARR